MADSFNDYTPGKFFKAEDLEAGPLTFTIASITNENIAKEGDPKETKGVVKFSEDERGVTVNGERRDQLKEIFGVPSKAIGQKVQLVRGKTKFQGKSVPCVHFAPATK